MLATNSQKINNGDNSISRIVALTGKSGKTTAQQSLPFNPFLAILWKPVSISATQHFS
jgi:hypothetical protein